MFSIRRKAAAALLSGSSIFTLLLATHPAQAATGADVVAKAESQLGVLEGSAQADAYLAEAGLPGYSSRTTPWCAAFVTWVEHKSGASSFTSASVKSWVDAARAHQYGLSVVTAPQVGDLAAYDWDGDNNYTGDQHIGIVTTTLSSSGIFNDISGNSSGEPDLVARNTRRTNAGYNVTFLHTTATGGTPPPGTVPPSGDRDIAAAANFTGDNLTDLFAMYNDGNVGVLTSGGSSFVAGANWYTGAGMPRWSGDGDFNGDGKADVANWYPDGNGTVRVMLSNGTAFPSSTVWATNMGLPSKVVAADFTGDGKADIAAWQPDGTIAILSSLGNAFSAKTWTSGFAVPAHVTAGQFNGDHYADLVAWYGDKNGTVKVLTSTGSGFSSADVWTSNMGDATYVGAGDLTGDGLAELVAMRSTGEVSVLTSGGKSFVAASDWTKNFGAPAHMSVGRFTADTKADVALWYPNGDIKVLVSNGVDGFSSGNLWTSNLGNPTFTNGGPG